MKLFWGSIVFISLACLAPRAFAGPDWTNTGPSNVFDNPQNWTTVSAIGVAIPGPSDSMHIFPGFTTFPNGLNTDITVQQGGATTINITTVNNQSVKSFLVSSNFDGNAITNGVLNFSFTNNSTLTVGVDGAVTTGNATVNYNGNLLEASGNFLVGTVNSEIDPGQVIGPGTFNVQSGFVNFAGSTTVFVGDGTTGIMTQGTSSSSSTVVIGGALVLGDDSGSGNYIVAGGSTLQNGNANSVMFIGTFGSSGTLTLENSSTLNWGNASDIQVGAGGAGLVTQGLASGADNPTVNLNASATMEIGDDSSGSGGIYQLNSGFLNVNNSATLTIGAAPGATGVLNQAGGVLTVGASAIFIVGGNGTGQYNMSAGVANFNNGLTVGLGSGSGTVNQTGGSIVVIAGQGQIGVSGQGTYNLSAGTVDFQGGAVVGGIGTFAQSGGILTSEGTMTIAGAYTMTAGTSTLNSGLNITTGFVNLNGGTLTVAANAITGPGKINLGGGTLKILSGGPTDYMYTATSVLSGGTPSVIDTSSSNLTKFTFKNYLSGAGGLLLNGNGSTVFNFASSNDPSHNNTFTGVAGISNGTLNAIQNDLASTSGLVIGSGGMLNLRLNSAGFAYGGSGGLSGSGQLNVIFDPAGTAPKTNVLVLPNANNYTGAIVLGATNPGTGIATSGTLQIYNGTYSNISDNAGTANSVVIGGAPLIGALAVPASGSVVLQGANYTGLTTINPGFSVQANNFLGSVMNAGTLSPIGSFSNPGTMKIGGTLNSTGVISVFANGTSATSYLVAGAGASSLSGVISTIGSGTKQYAVVTATGGPLTIGGNGLLNDPNGLTTNPNQTLFSTTLSFDPATNTLFVNTNQIPLGTFAVTPAQKAVAGSLDPLTQTPPPAFAQLLTIMNGLTPAEIAPALTQLSTENLQFSRQIAFENSTFLSQRVNGMLSNVRSGQSGLDSSGISYSVPGFTNGLSHSMNSLLASNAPTFHTTAPNGVNYYPDDGNGPSGPTLPASDYEQPAHPSRMTPAQAASPTSYDGQVLSDSPIPMRTSQPPTLRTSRFSEFVSGDVVLADINANANQDIASKASYTAGDVMAGATFRMTSNLSVGVLFDYNHTNAKTDGNGSKTEVNSYTPGVFATYYDHDFYVNGLFAFGWNQYSNTRVISFGGLNGNANSSPNGQQYTANIDTGYDFHPAKQWVVGPTLGLTYTHLDIDSSSESGLPLTDLNINSQSADSLRSRLGGHIEYIARAGSVVFQPNITAMWQHEYLSNGGITASWQSFPTAAPFTTPVAAPTSDSALLGCGLTATLDNSMAFYLNYLADVGAGDYLSQSIVGGVKASF